MGSGAAGVECRVYGGERLLITFSAKKVAGMRDM
jgi:hypothetical protein